MNINFIDHIVIYVKDFDISRKFYTEILGGPFEDKDDSVIFMIGQTRLFITTLRNKAWAGKYNKENIGMNHLAFGVETFQELSDISVHLKHQKIPNSGIQIDDYGKKPFIWFDDPDGIRLEFYHRAGV
jgi:glyoxylase I family protein